MSGQWSQRIAQFLRMGKQTLTDVLSSNSNNEIFGITVSADFINILKIKQTNSHYQVENFNNTPLPSGIVVKYEIRDPVALATIMKSLFRQSQMTNNSMAFCIPRSLAIMKNITVDNRLTPDEIESKVWIEANRLFPNLIEDIYLDYVVLGISTQDASQRDVLVVACRKELIKPYLDMIRLAELNVKIIDINYFAYERALYLMAKQSPDLKTIGLINIGSYLINLIVMHEGNAIFTHEVSYDSSSLRNIMQPRMTYQHAMAGDEVDSSNSSETESNLFSVLNQELGMQVKHIMQFFYSSRPNIRIERLILSGECVIGIPDLVKYIKLEVGKDVVLANPFKEMTFSHQVDKEKLAHFTPSLVLCCGVALRNINE